MAEYVERSEAIEFVKQNTPTIDGETTMQCVVRSLKKVPSADVVKVVHGYWVKYKAEHYKCSICGNRVGGITTKYCSECGAKMDGKGD